MISSSSTQKSNDVPTARLGSLLATQADDTLSWVTHAALDMLESVDYVSISTVGRAGIESTVGSTDPLAFKADLLQYELGQGPCLNAASGEAMAQSADLAHDPTWPDYGPQAAQLGMRSQLALRISSSGATIGSLNLYSTRAGGFDETTIVRAQRLAGQAGTALEMTRMAGDLSRVLASRSHIAQATGLLMARHQWTSQQAFDHMVNLSQDKNVKLREIARDLVETANEDVDADGGARRVAS